MGAILDSASFAAFSGTIPSRWWLCSFCRRKMGLRGLACSGRLMIDRLSRSGPGRLLTTRIISVFTVNLEVLEHSATLRRGGRCHVQSAVSDNRPARLEQTVRRPISHP